MVSRKETVIDRSYSVLLMQGSFTGTRIFLSGFSLRTEATGYGLVTFFLISFFRLRTLFKLKSHKSLIKNGIFSILDSFLLNCVYLLQVYFAQLVLAEMNKELKGLRYFT